MRQFRNGSNARGLTLRSVAAAIGLFAAGGAIGVIAITVFPMMPAMSLTAPPDKPEPRAVVAVDDEPVVDDCVPGSLQQRAAQVLVLGLPDVTSASEPLATELTELGVGGVFINDANASDAAQVVALTDGLRANSRLPLMVATDEEAGRVSTFRHIIGATSSPRTLASTRTAEDVRSYAADLGSGLADLGIDTDLAPVADLDAGPSTGVIGDRSFSADPHVASEYAEAFASGLTDAGVVPVVKHFPGHGRAVDDVHKQGTVVDTPLEELLAVDVMPFTAMIDAGVPVVMVGHPTYGALNDTRPASLAPEVYELLRDLGFEGVAMTDSIGMGAVHRHWQHPEAAVMAVRAGADAVLSTDGRHAAAMVEAIVEAVTVGELDEARLDEAVARMLALKGVDPAELTCTEVPPPPEMAAVDGR